MFELVKGISVSSMRRRNERSDARRSRAAILRAALETLGDRPAASLSDIALAAGVSRGTLYGHFAGRRPLLVAAFRMMRSEVDRQLANLDPELSAPEALDELVATSWWVLGHCAGMTIAARAEVTSLELQRLHDEPLTRIRKLLARGRREGLFRTDQSLEWQVECFYAIVQAGASQIRDGRMPAPEAAAQMVTTIRAVLQAEAAASVGEAAQHPVRPGDLP